MSEILIVNDGRDAGCSYAPFFETLDMEITEDNSVLDRTQPGKTISLVVFTGGDDVQPTLYGDTSPKRYCYTNPQRDSEEVKLFNIAKKNNIPMFGICRGLQFINIMAGGKLIHHLAGHNGKHDVSTSDKETFPANSLHHQACIPPTTAEVLAWSTEKLSHSYIGDKDEEFDYYGAEVESVYYPAINSAGVQWHPEALQDISDTQKPRAKTWAWLLARDLIKCTGDGIRKLYYIDRPRINYVQ